MDGTESSRDKIPIPDRLSDSLVSKKKIVGICLLLAGGVIAVYWRALRFQFVNFDDLGYILQNPHVQLGVTPDSIRWALTSFYAGNWHPLTWLSHALDCQLFGLNAGGHHLTNLLLHAANTVLLFLWLRSITGATRRSAFVAGLFGLHPMHVESVAWIAERKDVLSTFFFILTLWAYSKYVGDRRPREKESGVRSQEPGGGEIRMPNAESRKKSECRMPNPEPALPRGSAPSRNPRSRLWYSLTLVLFALGLMSKPMLVTVPFVLLLLDFWPLRRFQLSTLNFQLSTFRRLLVEKLPFFALSAADSILTFLAQQGSDAVASATVAPREVRLFNSMISYALYLKKMVWPGDMAVYYPYREDPPLIMSLVAVLVLIALSVVVIRFLRTRPYLAFGWFWFLGTLVPVIGLVQVGLQSMADRYTYIPYIGLFIAITWALGKSEDRMSKSEGQLDTVTPTLALTPTLSPKEREKARSAKAEGQSDAVTPTLALTLTLSPRLRRTSARRAEEREKPRSAVAALAIAVLVGCGVLTAFQLRFWKDSETLWRHALEVTSGNAIARGNLGSALVERARFAEAAEQFREALKVKPLYPEAESNLGFALAMQGQNEEAMTHYRQALALKPNMERTHFLLGNMLLGQGKRAEAISEYKAALEINRDWPAALNDLAWILATDPDAALRDGSQAVDLGERACQVTGYRNPQFIGTLAAAYAEAGRFEEAVATANQAKELAARIGRTDLVERNEQLLQLYRNKTTYHEKTEH